MRINHNAKTFLTTHCTKLLVPIWFALLGGCGYSVKVNDNVVYTPAPLLTDFAIADINLRNCLDQTISDKKITAFTQMLSLNCSNAGIVDLAGLERFTALQELNLADNGIQNLAPLAKLTQLKVLVLRDNKLTSVASLLGLLHLSLLDVEQNPQLKCTDIKQLAANLAETHAEIIKPTQCQ